MSPLQVLRVFQFQRSDAGLLKPKYSVIGLAERHSLSSTVSKPTTSFPLSQALKLWRWLALSPASVVIAFVRFPRLPREQCDV